MGTHCWKRFSFVVLRHAIAIRYCIFLVVVSIFLLIVLVSVVHAGFTARAKSLKIFRSGKAVGIRFMEGLTIVSAEGYTVRAGFGEILFRREDFPHLKAEAKAEEVLAGDLPELPKITFRKSDISYIRFGGGVQFRSEGFSASCGLLESSDAGDTWRIGGGVSVKLDRQWGSKRILAEEVVFNRLTGWLISNKPITVVGFFENNGDIKLSAERITIDLASAEVMLNGSPAITSGDYKVTANAITANMKSKVIVAEGSVVFFYGSSLLTADKLDITSSEGRIELIAENLSGKLALP